MATGVIRHKPTRQGSAQQEFACVTVWRSCPERGTYAAWLFLGQWPTADRLPRQRAALQSFEHSGRAPLLAALLPRPSGLADRLPAKL